ncbi:MAG: SPOR domain-containing protein [Betaproteobacteria bacterium]|jgi:cell division protein FtsN|uniref:SPOR domain-containing protein n=1 Tax=Candidatus Proximibacter danicus TaxID=2954365 RepID=A0A9D7K1R0_9PROT|nr:SPOR domain-containing protein [Candidatus Proximibacter danicus]
MSRDMKPKRAPAKKKSHGGTLVGLFVGLVLGIVGAAAVVWYINKMPAPFKPQIQPAQPVPAKPENGKAAPAGQTGTPALLPGKPGDPVPEKRFQFYDILPGKVEAKVDSAAKPEQKDAKAEGKEGKAEGKDSKEAALKDPLFLQAGSFQTAGDADNQKAKLALLGLEAAVQQVMVQDKVWFRVRLGPYAKLDEVNRVRSDLAKQGIEAAVVKKD